MLTIGRINEVLAAEPAIVLPLERTVESNTREGSPTAASEQWMLDAASEWATVLLGASSLRDLLEAVGRESLVPGVVKGELDRFLDQPLPPHPTLAAHLESLLGEARDAQLLAERELVPEPPTLEQLAIARGLTRERIRQKVAGDIGRIQSTLHTARYQSVRWAIERLRADLGTLTDTGDEVVVRWRNHCGTQFETLRWLAGYTYQGSWLIQGAGAMNELVARIDEAIAGEWLVSATTLSDQLASSCDPALVTRLLVDSGRWRDIGDGWLVRWDGPLQAKAERVLRLTCTPMTPSELVTAIGHGSEVSLKNQRGDRLVRIDKSYRLALREWGIEEYEGIVEEIRQRIERGGGAARKSAIIEEFTRSFGVSRSSVETYLHLPMFDLAGDVVRLGNDQNFVPRSPTTVAGAVEVAVGWGQRLVVTETTYRGYSFGVSNHVCWANGLRPGDDLLVPLNDSALHASVIWRTTTLSGTVDVGRVREWLVERNVPIGAEVLVCPSPTAVTIIVGSDEIEVARHASEATAPPLAADIAAMMEQL